MYYRIEQEIPAKAIVDLRESVGWNRMEQELSAPDLYNTFAIGCYFDGKLIGYLCVVNNGITDAYIQEVMVDPAFQGQGIGTKLMEMAIV